MSPHISQLVAMLALMAATALPAAATEPGADVPRSPVWSLGVEAGAGAMPAVGLWPALPAAHDFTATQGGLRLRHASSSGDWVLRLSVLDLRLQDGNYRSISHGWDDTQFVRFDPVSFYYLQVNREWVFARLGRWRWSWSAGGGLGLLTGAMTLQNAQGCRASNWRHADTDPAWGGCYHDPDPYGSTRVEFPPVMAFLHAALGLSRRYGPATFHAQGGFFLPGFFGLSIAVEWDFPR